MVFIAKLEYMSTGILVPITLQISLIVTEQLQLRCAKHKMWYVYVYICNKYDVYTFVM